MSCLRSFSALCGVSLILLATTTQPAAAQGDPCAAYIDNTPYYQRCQQINQQSARIREEQEQRSKRAAEVREERLDRFYNPENRPPQPTRSKKDARAAAYEKIAPTPATTTTETKAATIPVTPSTTPAQQAVAVSPAATDTSSPAPTMQGAGYIVIDPAKLTTEQLQAIMAILKQSSPQANLTPSTQPIMVAPAAQAVAGQAQVIPDAGMNATQPFSQNYPVVTGREGTTAVTLPDIGQGTTEVMEIEPVDPASLLQP
ncbi:MAG: hypothetical protein EP349_10830 [Alphaproteobacteria bacterium]|nr:MAG: hypothetical protein EP349_10830 [Alphaproteobacteria bacterium]